MSREKSVIVRTIFWAMGVLKLFVNPLYPIIDFNKNEKDCQLYYTNFDASFSFINI